MLFKTYFDGTGKVRMVVCVNPRASDYDETVVSFSMLHRIVPNLSVYIDEMQMWMSFRNSVFYFNFILLFGK